MSRLKDLRKIIDRELLKVEDEEERLSCASHLYGVSLAAVLIARRRGMDPELPAMAAMMHDMNAYLSGSYDDHAHKGAELAGTFLRELGQTTPEEDEAICSMIWHHDDKGTVDSPLDEVLKDADVIHHCFNDPAKPVKEKERARYEALCREFRLNG